MSALFAEVVHVVKEKPHGVRFFFRCGFLSRGVRAFIWFWWPIYRVAFARTAFVVAVMALF